MNTRTQASGPGGNSGPGGTGSGEDSARGETRSVPTGTWAPSPAPARLPRMVLATGLMELRLLLRNGEQVLLAAVIPLLVLVAGTYAPVRLGPGRPVDIMVPGVLALATMSTAFTSLAIATGFERRYGVLKRLGASPLPRTGLLAGKAMGVLVILAAQFVVVGLTGLGLGWSPGFDPAGAGTAVALSLAGTWAFASLGLLMAGLLRAEATLAGANLVYLVLLVGGATVLPASEYPAVLSGVVGWLPSGALAEGLRAVAAAGGTAWGELGVLCLWAAAASAIAARTFRWD